MPAVIQFLTDTDNCTVPCVICIERVFKKIATDYLVESISPAYPAVLLSVLRLIASWRKISTAELFMFWQVHIENVAPWEAFN